MNFFVSFFLSLAIGVLTTLACISLLMPVASRIGLVDTPGGRKTHAHPVPLIGGIAIFLGFSFSLLCLNISLSHYRGLLAGSAILILIGVVDDFRELSPRIRLAGQFLVSLLLIEWGHLSLLHLGNLFFVGDINTGTWSFFLTAFFVLSFINAINMIDGNDGLAASIVAAQAFFLVLLYFYFQQFYPAFILMLFIVVIGVFLFFNFPLSFEKRASVFLGDAGSTFLGFVIIWFAIALSQQMATSTLITAGTFSPMTILWVLAYPFLDLITVTMNRLRIGRSPFSGGRDHFHHVLLKMGVHPKVLTILLFAFSVLLGAIGIIFAKLSVSESWQCMVFLGTFIFYFFTYYFLQTSAQQYG